MQAFRDALQLQSSVGASPGTAEAQTAHASADVPDASAEAATAAVHLSVLADASCQVNTTSSGPAETGQPRKSSNATAAAENDEAGGANQDAAAAKAEAERLKVCRSAMLGTHCPFLRGSFMYAVGTVLIMYSFPIRFHVKAR